MRNISGKCCRGNQNTHFAFNNTPPSRKPCRLWDVAKYCRAGRATVDIMAPAYCVLDTQGYHGSNGYPNAPQYCVIRTLPNGR